METVRGFKDYTGEEARKRAEIRKILVDTFEKYNFYREISRELRWKM